MSVVIETTLGDITVDLYLEQRPVTCLNFLKLCKMKYYNFNLFHSIRSGFIAQTGDPTAEGSGGQSIFGLLEGPEKRFFSGEKLPKIRHSNTGTLSMVCTGDMMVGSQFFFTLAPDLDSLDSMHCVIGEVTEGHDVLRMLNDVICDESHRPYRDVRITHTVVLEDPFNDPAGLRAPSRSPSPSAERLKGGRIAPDEDIDEAHGKSAQEIQELIEEKEAKARATILEIVGDIPDADIAPPENVLFVCKLNPVTTDEDLEIIFSRFGKIVGCEVIRDKKSGDSLQYAFIEFSDKKSCEDAYFKMDNVLIDDRRIHVDFSQSVSRMRWMGKGKGIKYYNNNESKDHPNDHSFQRHHNKDREREDHNNGRVDDNNQRRHQSKDSNHHRRYKNDRDSKHETSDRHNRDKKNDRDRSKRDRSNSRTERSDRDRSRRDRSRSRDKSRRIDRSEKTRKEKSHSEKTSEDQKERSSRRDKSEDKSCRYPRNRSSSTSLLSPSKLKTSQNETSIKYENRNRPEMQISHSEISRNESRSKTNKSKDELLSNKDRSQSNDRQDKLHEKNYTNNNSEKDYNDQNKPKSSRNENSESERRILVHERTKKEYKNDDSNKSPNKDHINTYGKQHIERDDKKTEDTNKFSKETKKQKQRNDDKEISPRTKQRKSDKNYQEKDPRTPTPVTKRGAKERKEKIVKKMESRKKKNTVAMKKKRKYSTSSSESSSDSSSTSESSSSSEEDRKKKALKRRKKKVSTSSSSSSSTTTTSSSSSTDSSSSSSESEPSKKKRKKNVSSKVDNSKKTKKKL